MLWCWYLRQTVEALSRNEVSACPLIETMAASAALVASRAGAAELVVEDGVSAALAAVLEPLMRDSASCAAMGTRGRARACQLQPRCGSRADRGGLTSFSA